MKNSISLIMVVCLSSVLVFSSFAEAAYTVAYSVIGEGDSTLINSELYAGDTKRMNSYEHNIAIKSTLAKSTPYNYISGFDSFSVTFKFYTWHNQNTTLNLHDPDIIYNPINSNNNYSYLYSVTKSTDEYYTNYECRIFVVYENHYDRYDEIQLGNFNIKWDVVTDIGDPGDVTTPLYIVNSLQNGRYLSASSTPNNIGMVDTIIKAIDTSSDFETLKVQTDLLEDYMRNFPQYSSQVVYYLQELYGYLSEADLGATEAADAADQAASQAAAIAAVPRPNAGAIINEGVNRIDTDISSGFGVLGAILNEQWYIWILMIVISLAFVSYLMYGKGV